MRSWTDVGEGGGACYTLHKMKSIPERSQGRRRGPGVIGAAPRQVRVFLRRSVPRIVSAFPRVQQIILFGSYASGRPTRDSDVDLFIVMPTTQRWSDRVRQVQALFPDRPAPLDVIVRTPQEVRRRLTSYFCPLTREIFQKGRVIYEAAPRRS